MITLNNAANTYTGNTEIDNGTLILSGSATIAQLAGDQRRGRKHAECRRSEQCLSLVSGQTLNNNSNTTVVGNVVAASGATITGSGTFSNHVTLHAGSNFRSAEWGCQRPAGERPRRELRQLRQ